MVHLITNRPECHAITYNKQQIKTLNPTIFDSNSTHLSASLANRVIRA
jgi:hypothetical protein